MDMETLTKQDKLDIVCCTAIIELQSLELLPDFPLLVNDGNFQIEIQPLGDSVIVFDKLMAEKFKPSLRDIMDTLSYYEHPVYNYLGIAVLILKRICKVSKEELEIELSKLFDFCDTPEYFSEFKVIEVELEDIPNNDSDINIDLDLDSEDDFNDFV